MNSFFCYRKQIQLFMHESFINKKPFMYNYGNDNNTLNILLGNTDKIFHPIHDSYHWQC